MTFEEYIKKHIFEPAGMLNSTFYQPEVPRKLATKPHILGDQLERKVSEVYPYNRRHAGSSTLHSNVEDMLLWAQAYLNKGTINGRKIFSQSALELMTTAQTKTDDSKVKIGLSWFLTKLKRSPVVFHQGGDLGYSTFLCLLPKEDTAIVLMANTDDFWQEYVAEYLIVTTILGQSVPLGKPIHYELKNYILTEGIEKTKAVYHDRKNRFAETTNLSSGLLDDLGFWLMERGHYQAALEIFLFNTELEPKDAGWADSVGDAYVALGSNDAAVKWYQKALEMNPKQGFTREKLKKLQVE